MTGPYRNLTISMRLEGTEDLDSVLSIAKELEATLEHVASLIERITPTSGYNEPLIRNVSEKLYEQMRERLS